MSRVVEEVKSMLESVGEIEEVTTVKVSNEDQMKVWKLLIEEELKEAGIDDANALRCVSIPEAEQRIVDEFLKNRR
ncbi:unnamed protein product [Caenorhabditis bovis]|uniref:Uncharacterized protein n=1 Tax=Caenorhabditis bovis TaxID=2654633 RepID=A0A8S1ET60_9PELO|nr:unnamed protein product [Caenorhabditis bovis]